MRKIEWELSIGLVGCRQSGEVFVEDDATEEDIDETVRDEALSRVDYWWKEA